MTVVICTNGSILLSSVMGRVWNTELLVLNIDFTYDLVLHPSFICAEKLAQMFQKPALIVDEVTKVKFLK